ncbi:TAXI family TRAP transporter solute-binding subunit [Niallia sp. Krafla_26]|uniref:TAXI family TRAP transporter solute-binding subunit n=1 Tax=Niallia sp. Krafla_26 TaxID=3064703 RepID=UPI003D16EC9B
MKKIKVILGALALLMLMTLIGCNSQETNQKGEQTDERFTGIVPFYTPPSGNIYYTLAAGISNMINQSDDALEDVMISAESTQGDAAMLEQLVKSYEQGKPAFGFGDTSQIKDEHPYINAVLNVGISGMHVVVKADSDIKAYEDLKGKKLGGFAPNISPRILFEKLLVDQFNIKPDQYEMIPLENQDRIDSLIDGSVDAALIMGNAPNPLITELSRGNEIRILSIPTEKIEAFLESNTNYATLNIPAATYDGINEDVNITALTTTLLTHEKTPDELVTLLLETIIENPEKIKEMNPAFNITLDKATQYITIPFHTGAKSYFEENEVEIE